MPQQAAVRDLPLQPLSLRQLVGLTDESAFDNRGGQPIYSNIPLEKYRSVFDFGCGCGRQARQLIQQNPRPQRYIGIDLHPPVIAWCQENLTPFAPEFTFYHQDVFNPGLNPSGSAKMISFPTPNQSVSLLLATSVFTHLDEAQAYFYLQEVARVLEPGGIMASTWFLFNKATLPMMQPFQNTLYINLSDPSNAVIFDRGWLHTTSAALGLIPTYIQKPTIRGFHWYIHFTRTDEAGLAAAWPEDDAPFGSFFTPETVT